MRYARLANTVGTRVADTELERRKPRALHFEQVPELDLSKTFGETDQARLTEVLAPFLSTDLGTRVLQVMTAAIEKHGTSIPPFLWRFAELEPSPF